MTPGGADAEASGIKVVVRVRPLNDEELAETAGDSCVRSRSSTHLDISDDAGDGKAFTFDDVFWSAAPEDEDFASQQTLMEKLGVEMTNDVLDGRNACLIASGPPGSGKTFSILGGKDDHRGLLPRIAAHLFAHLDGSRAAPSSTSPPPPAAAAAAAAGGAGGGDGGGWLASASYLELYNDELRDLLAPLGAPPERLDVLFAPRLGARVPGLRSVPVFSAADVEALIDYGAKNRVMAATSMNCRSSRAHCIFALELRQGTRGPDGRSGWQLRSRATFVDLAGAMARQQGSAAAAPAAGRGGREPNAAVARSLADLAALGGCGGGGGGGGASALRESRLRSLLQEPLTGNCRTTVLATISPASSGYLEALNALSFVEGAGRLRTRATRTLERAGDVLGELQVEARRLRSQAGCGDPPAAPGLFESLVEVYGRDQEAHRRAAADLERGRREALGDLGCGLPADARPDGRPAASDRLVNLSADASLEGRLAYGLAADGGPVSVGTAASCRIRLRGVAMKPMMAVLEHGRDSEVWIQAVDGRVLVNGSPVQGRVRLRCGDRLILGYSFCFRFVSAQAGKEDPYGAQGLEGHLEQALAEVAPEESEAYQQCRWYVERLQARVGASQVQAFRRDFSQVVQLVDEANAITKEVRQKDRLEFSVEVLVGLMKYNEEEPRCVVRLKRHEPWSTRLGAAIRRSGVQPAPEAGRPPRPAPPEPFTTVAVLTVEAFRARLRHLREVYDLFLRGGRDGLDFSRAECDPWSDGASWDVAGLVREGGEGATSSPARQEAVMQQQHQQLQLLHESNRDKEAQIFHLQQQVVALQRTLVEAQSGHATAAIASPERPLAQTPVLPGREAAASATTPHHRQPPYRERGAQLAGSGGGGGGVAAPSPSAVVDVASTAVPALEEQLACVGDETLAAAELTQRLLMHLQDIKQDLRDRRADLDVGAGVGAGKRGLAPVCPHG